MRSCLSLFLVCLLSLVLISGCGAPVGSTFESNAKAVQMLGGKTFGDAEGNVSLSFNADGKLTNMSIKDIPPEYQGIKIDGTPFSITIPNDPSIPAAFAGMAITASLANTQTTISDTGAIQLVFSGNVNVPLVQGITLTINANANEAGTSLNNIGVSLSASVPFVGSVPVFSQDNLAGGIPVVVQ